MDPARQMRCMILCGGYGTRLGDLTKVTPKPMLTIQGRPLLEYIVSHLALHGYSQIALNLHFMPERIVDYMDTGERWGVEIAYSHEAELLGTAGALRKMDTFLVHGDAFLVQYGDVVTDQDVTAMLAYHRQHGALATVLLHTRQRSNSVVEMDDVGRITGFWERPAEDVRRKLNSPWVNSGLCICDPAVLRMIPEEGVSDLPGDIFPKLVATGRLHGFPLTGYRCAIDSMQRLAEARQAVATGRCNITLTPRSEL